MSLVALQVCFMLIAFFEIYNLNLKTSFYSTILRLSLVTLIFHCTIRGGSLNHDSKCQSRSVKHPLYSVKLYLKRSQGCNHHHWRNIGVPQRKNGVFNENLGVSNENLDFSNENNGDLQRDVHWGLQ